MSATIAHPRSTLHDPAPGRDLERRSWPFRGIRVKMYAGFGPVLLLMALVGAFALYSLDHVGSLSGSVYEDSVVSVEHLGQMRADVSRINMSAAESLSDPAGAGSYASEINSTAGEMARLESAYASRRLSPTEQQGLSAYQHDWSQYRAAVHSLLTLLQHSRLSSAKQSYQSRVAPLNDRLDADVQHLVQVSDREAQVLDRDINNSTSNARTLTIALLLAALVLSGGIGFFLSRIIAGTASEVARVAKGLAAGDINQRLDTHSNDELGDMVRDLGEMVAYQSRMAAAADAIARGEINQQVEPVSERDVLGTAFHRMTANLREVVTDLKRGSQHLASASSEILAATSQQASGTAEQAAAIAQTTATVDEVRASAEQSSALAIDLATNAQQASRVASDGVTAVGEATSGMYDIRQRVQSIAENILALSEQSQQIGEIITTVNDLADQSNLLALNAAIEASRAGEHGKGFTVVAQEIRTLAEQSKKATAQIRTILSDIQGATNAAVMATEQGTKGVDSGAILIDKAGRTIDELRDVILQSEQAAAQIAAAVRQHSAGMEQIAAAMSNINQATSQNLTATNSTEQAAQNLTHVADNLNQLIARYQS